jgi:hypothetical protein
MSGYAKDYYIIDPAQKSGSQPPSNVDLLCNAIYPSSLFIMQGVIEGLVCLFVLFMSKGVALYVKRTTLLNRRMVEHRKRTLHAQELQHAILVLIRSHARPVSLAECLELKES